VPTTIILGCDHEKFWALIVDALERVGDPPQHSAA
jgi:hypothetical protein